LAEKAAFLECYGAMPKCPKCFGGHLKFDYNDGYYFCKGFYDDTDKVECDSRFEFSTI
jgi:hypothetical protein